MSKEIDKPKKRGRKPKYDWDKLKPLMLALARLGYDKPGVLSRAIGIPHQTLENYLKHHKEFRESLKMASAEFSGYLLHNALKQVEKGYWPAIEFFLKRSLDRLDQAHKESLVDNKLIIEFKEIKDLKGNNDEDNK